MKLFQTIFAVSLLAVVLGGCSSSPPQADPRDKAIADPMNYNPAGAERRSISGGGLFDFDKKEFGKDVNSALNP